MLKTDNAAFILSVPPCTNLLRKLGVKAHSICYTSSFKLFLILLMQVAARREDTAHLTFAAFGNFASQTLMTCHPVPDSWCIHTLYSVEF